VVHTPGRRNFLRAVGAGTILPLLGSATANASTDPDQLFKAGRFAEADRGYDLILHRDPDNARAAAQRGYIALLCNNFQNAERFLTKAVELAPADTFSKQQLADCYVRQDQLARAVPLLRASGNEAYATQLASVTGTPYEVHGAQTTIFYHFLTTMDYANKALILRRKTRAHLREFQAETRRGSLETLPLWLAADHFPCTLGSLNDYGPRMVSLDTGGAVARDIYGIAGPLSMDDRFRFDTIANFTHTFFKPYAITFDFMDMNFHITGKSKPPLFDQV
jgi:hypothetical protein